MIFFRYAGPSLQGAADRNAQLLELLDASIDQERGAQGRNERKTSGAGQGRAERFQRGKNWGLHSPRL